MNKKKKYTITYCKSILFFAIIFVFTSPLFSQGESNIWYFGDEAGIDFNTNPPTALTASQMKTNEGCGAVSDENGNLLFYTNGVNVWNKDHQIMPNGFSLQGNNSSTQSAIIVPYEDSLYYIFAITAQSGSSGLTYSLINMNLDSGRGDIISGMKNITVLGGVTEALTAVLHSNCQDIWIITRTISDGFYAYLLTPNGLNTTPVISNIGPTNSEIGAIKVSPDNKFLVSTNFNASAFNGAELYDFSNTSGTISNLRIINATGSNNTYGAEFSPSSEILYLGHIRGTRGREILQYDLNAPDIEATEFSVITFTTSLGSIPTTVGTMQLGPDNKIYIARYQSFLSVINNPDILGLGCNAVDTGFVLASGTASISGLPQRIIIKRSPIDPIDLFCLNDTATNLAPLDSGRIWFGTGIVDSILGTFDPKIAGIGSYEVIYTLDTLKNCPNLDTITVKVNPAPIVNYTLDNDSICLIPAQPINFNNVLDTNLGMPETITWDFGDGSTLGSGSNVSHEYNSAGVYDVSLSVTYPDSIGCEGNTERTEAITVFANPIAAFEYSPDPLTTEDIELNLEDQSTHESPLIDWTWNINGIPISNEQHPIYSILEVLECYTVELIVTDINGCSDTTDRKINVVQETSIFISNSFTPNEDGLNDIFEPNLFGINEYKMTIFNRWGEQLFESDQINPKWDGTYKGKIVPTGVYIVKVEYSDADGKKHSEIKHLNVIK